ncbi:MAG: Mov34/MPN/PAD-1 family protein [Acidobacteriota bacterium]|nr:Mov34/MPN/PAD-1 family protein [Acidobacteriota bacterium]
MSSRKSKSVSAQPHVLISGEVLRQIRQHARSSSKTEVCGVLIGDHGADANKIKIAACIAGLNAAQAGTHVTFTQDTWEHIYKIKDSKFPEARIVGWYHSHPGFGVFLSDHDTFIHKNFFSSPLQVAWVYDPHSDEEGCFGWIGDRLERLSEISVEDGKGGEGAGETGKPEPVIMGDGDDQEERDTRVTDAAGASPVWLRRVASVITHLTLLIAGFLIGWYLPPRVFYVPVDARTGKQVGQPIDERELERAVRERRARQPIAPSESALSPAPSAGENSLEKGKKPAPDVGAAPGNKSPDKSNLQPPDKKTDPYAP